MLVYTFEPDETITIPEIVLILKMIIAADRHSYPPIISVEESYQRAVESELGSALRHFTIDKS